MGSDSVSRRIPTSWFQASPLATTMMFLAPGSRTQERDLAPGERRVGWLILPDFQRPPVWTAAQRARFIESAWMGLPIGVFVWNDAPDTPYHQWLLDGQQRVTAVIDYMADAFPVFGYRFSELTVVDHRKWDMMIGFPCLKTSLTDRSALREVYDRLAYGGTPHDPSAALSSQGGDHG
jgi:hypothetical protein